MRRDYKDYRSSPRARDRGRGPGRRQGLPGWVWGLAGLSVGLAVAAWVYLGGRRAEAPAPPRPPVSAPAPAETPKKASEPPPAAPRADAPPAPPKPRFEFYTMLPEMEVPTREPGAAKPPEPPAGKTSGETYILQVASFRTYQEADRLKASLLLLGMEASIQSVTPEGKAPVHRVRVGPYTDMAKVNEARRRLKEHALDPILVKGRT